MRQFSRDTKSGRKDSNRLGYGSSRSFSRGSERPAKRRFGRPNFEKGMHSAVCGKCGERCEVPFKPTGEKPVYCSSCFQKNDRSESRSPSKSEFNMINEKLDRILDALSRR